MKELKNVLKRLQDEEVKLSSEKVELGLTQDAEKAISNYYGATDKALNKGQDAYKLLNAAISEFTEMLKTADKLESYKSKLESAAKDLGVPTSGWKIIEELEIAIKNSKELTQYKKALEKAAASL